MVLPPPAAPQDEARKKPTKRKIQSIQGIRHVNGEQVGVVNFADAEQPEVVPWEELKKSYRLDVIKFYEKYIVTRAATEEEVRAVNEGC